MKKIDLADTKKGKILLERLEKPYGENSHPVVSIGITLKDAETPEYKVHIPLENLDELIEELISYKN